MIIINGQEMDDGVDEPNDDYGDQLQAQEPLATIIRETDEEYARGEALDSLDPSELGSISTTDGLEQAAELDEETNPRLFE